MYSLPFSDGTALILSVREAKPREKVQEKKSYTKMIQDAVYAEMERSAQRKA
jgi:predicted kinase